MKSTLATLLAPLLAATATAASAHGGHGLPGTSHWHASDTLGLLLVAVLAAGAWIVSRRK
jgi:hypothetical protein